MLQNPLKQELQIPTMGKEDLENEEWLTKVFRKSKFTSVKSAMKRKGEFLEFQQS